MRQASSIALWPALGVAPAHHRHGALPAVKKRPGYGAHAAPRRGHRRDGDQDAESQVASRELVRPRASGPGPGPRPVACTKIQKTRPPASCRSAAIQLVVRSRRGCLDDVAARQAARPGTIRHHQRHCAGRLNGGGFGGGGGASGMRFRRGGSGNGGQSFRANFTISNFSVAGVDIGRGELGPLSSASSARAGRSAPRRRAPTSRWTTRPTATQNKPKTGSTIAVGNKSGQATNFKVVGIVSGLPATTRRTYTSRSRWRRTWPA